MDFWNLRMVLLGICTALVYWQWRDKSVRRPSKTEVEADEVPQLNASVYELYSPPSTPRMDVLFFHGFQHGSYHDAHLSTWQSGDGACYWPKTWLVKRFGDARILTIAYNAVVMKCHESQVFDMFNMGENLASDLLAANIGQDPFRPVVLVGHSFGGLVIKQLCVYASFQTGILDRNSKDSYRLNSFLENVKGIFFYSTPHNGIADGIAEHFVYNGPLLEYVKTLSTLTARLNHDFDKLCGQGGQCKKWQMAAVGESLPTTSGRFHRQVVEEASSRYGSGFNLVERADHISVCRPLNETCRSFYALTNFLELIPLYLKPMVPGLPGNATGLESRAFDIQVKLQLNQPNGPTTWERQCIQRASTEDNCLVLGIVGMGGIGKTTIAKKVFDNISGQFEYTCFLDNVKGFKGNKLNSWILNQFLRAGSKVEQSSLEWSQLQNKITLIMMDDVDSANQFKSLPSLDHFGAGSRLMITSRKQGVLNYFENPVICEVDLLSFEEATKLFCQHAFRQEAIPENLLEMNLHLEENVKKVGKKCGGLPLTLEVMGSYLRSHKSNARIWQAALNKLGKAQSVDGFRDDRVWTSLKVSYDALLPEEQRMFIEAGTYFFEQPVERALDVWSTVYDSSDTAWANLLGACIVKEVEKTKEGDYFFAADITYKEVWMHEHLRDLAKNVSGAAVVSRFIGENDVFNANPVEAETTIVRLNVVKDANHLGNRAVDLFNANAVEAQSLMALRLHCASRDTLKSCEFPELHLEALDKFVKLKYLELVGVLPNGSSKNLSRQLCLLKWSSSDDGDTLGKKPFLSISLEDMTRLAVLELKAWVMPEDSFEALGKLSNLRTLSLYGIEGPARLPQNFGHLSQLKQLHLQFVKLTELPHSFGNLLALEYLVLGEMDAENLPESFGNLCSLKKLVIQKCRNLASLPESFGCLSSLVMLTIEDCPRLNYQHRDGFREFDSCEGLSSLTTLNLSDCASLARLPASFGLLSSLKQLELKSCFHLNRLPENIGELKDLERLVISRNYSMKALPDSFGNLDALRYLSLGCRWLQRLPASFGNLSALRKLDLYECWQLQELPESFGLLSSLEELSLAGCRALQRLPDNFGQLSALKQLVIAKSVQPEELSPLTKPGVESLWVNSLLEELCNHSSLELLWLESWESIETLPDSLGLISSLRTVILFDCTGLKSLPDSLGKNISPPGDNGLRLCVQGCPFLKMQQLGWIESGMGDSPICGSIGTTMEFIGHCVGDCKWYERKWH
ncbi:unnamed protein product [Calypogeia fissa]